MVKTFVPGLRLSADSVLSQVGKLLHWSWKDEMVTAKNEVDEKLPCLFIRQTECAQLELCGTSSCRTERLN